VERAVKQQSLSIRHEAVYHAAVRCQAASLPLTPHPLRGQKKACLIERPKNRLLFGLSSQEATLLAEVRAGQAALEECRRWAATNVVRS
jgi:hypothetical protein